MPVITDIKQLRKEIDEITQRVKDLPSSDQLKVVTIKLKEAVMWLGLELHEQGLPVSYPNSKDPSTGEIIDPSDVKL